MTVSDWNIRSAIAGWLTLHLLVHPQNASFTNAAVMCSLRFDYNRDIQFVSAESGLGIALCG